MIAALLLSGALSLYDRVPDGRGMWRCRITNMQYPAWLPPNTFTANTA